MKVIIAGSRVINDPMVVAKAIIDSGFKISEVVCGMASGVDKIGLAWGKYFNIPVKQFPANWDLHGKAAGPIRNKQMAQYADSLILVWDGKSKGSANMLKEAKDHKLQIFEVIINVNEK